MIYVKERKEVCRFRAAQEAAERKSPKKETEKAGFASSKTFERQKIDQIACGSTFAC
jgi:hypothetical protein